MKNYIIVILVMCFLQMEFNFGYETQMCTSIKCFIHNNSLEARRYSLTVYYIWDIGRDKVYKWLPDLFCIMV